MVYVLLDGNEHMNCAISLQLVWAGSEGDYPKVTKGSILWAKENDCQNLTFLYSCFVTTYTLGVAIF